MSKIEDIKCDVCGNLKSEDDCIYFEVCLEEYEEKHVCFYCLDEIYDKEKHEINNWHQIVERVEDER